ncbi:Chromo (CHRromatin Organization MOdifier) domain [Carpediemonas membranifera]|uniref:Chromo (CHRromatin Organization MOdifier) domain n=1 Tax=Carpediemonas membranifera TaxID=201153 RepID=A0A8J6E148_9EUKA|nr:Chromo (CHRromatin Organization MOdifier) domain [Carpediemonas membranifera]|eukprot:KAG9392636.1 Chromo (CHRromatin Organization MOdifier) domain [Carpediemonas membranifera]
MDRISQVIQGVTREANDMDFEHCSVSDMDVLVSSVDAFRAVIAEKREVAHSRNNGSDTSINSHGNSHFNARSASTRRHLSLDALTPPRLDTMLPATLWAVMAHGGACIHAAFPSNLWFLCSKAYYAYIDFLSSYEQAAHRNGNDRRYYHRWTFETSTALPLPPTWLRDSVLVRKSAVAAAIHRVSAATQDVPGDIPTLLRHAYSRHFHETLPRAPAVAETCDPVDLLGRLPFLRPSAQNYVDSARSILTDGPPLSMNIELAEGQELPVALHTLLQGTLWAIFMEFADPDLNRTEDDAYEDGVQYWPEDQLPWFLCKKFFFAHQIAERDGAVEVKKATKIIHRMYAGRIYELVTRIWPMFVRIRVPPVVAAYGMATGGLLMVTAKGVYGLNRSVQFIQFDELDSAFSRMRAMTRPARVAFSQCPAIAQFEVRLPIWHKDRLVKRVWMGQGAFMLTAAGLAVAGWDVKYYVGPGANGDRPMFRPVRLPRSFEPDFLVRNQFTVVIESGGRQMIGGMNSVGQLGLGHDNDVNGFVDLPFRVDNLVYGVFDCNFFFRGRQLLFAGHVDSQLTMLGLLPNHTESSYCLTATPLHFPEHVKGLMIHGRGGTHIVLWVGEGRTVYSDGNRVYEADFEVVQASDCEHFKDSYGDWWVAVVRDDDVEFEPCVEPFDTIAFTDVRQVDIDPIVE